MAFKLAEMFTVITVKDSKFKKGLANARVGMRNLASQAKRAGAVMAGMFVGAGFAAARLVKLANTQEDAVKKMEAALIATGQSVDKYSEALQKNAAALQKQTILGDEAILPVQAMALNMGIAADQVDDATKKAIGLSEAFGIDMKLAMRGVALAMEGNFVTLTRYIPALQSAKDETEQLAAFNKAAAAGFQQAQLRTKTFSGQLQQFSNELGDVGETLGEDVVKPLISGLLPGIRQAFGRGGPGHQALMDFGKSVLFVAEKIGLINEKVKIGTDREAFSASAVKIRTSSMGGAFSRRLPGSEAISFESKEMKRMFREQIRLINIQNQQAKTAQQQRGDIITETRKGGGMTQ